VFATPWAEVWLATYHPAAILRAPDPATRDRLFHALAGDLGRAAQAARSPEQHERCPDPTFSR